MRVPMLAYDLSAFSLSPPKALLPRPLLDMLKLKKKIERKDAKGAFLHDLNLDSTHVNALRPYNMSQG